MLEFSEQKLTVSNCSKIGGVDPRLISHRHHLDKFTLKGNFKIEPGFGVAHLQFQKITYLWCGGSVRGRDIKAWRACRRICLHQETGSSG